VFLVIPQCDLLTEQSQAMAVRLRAAGVETSDKIYPGATHSFLEAMSVAQIAREAIADGARFVAQALE
jgi:acetyl esterase